MFIPLGLEDRRFRRWPVVSIGIALVCVVVFIVQNIAPDPTQDTFRRAVLLLIQHPYVLPPPSLEERLPPHFLQQLEAAAAETNPEADVMYEQQRRLAAIADELAEVQPSSFSWKWGLVPSRGFLQVGWITSLFIHFGFGHLFFNLLFFYVVGPVLEERWGRLLFLGFYLAGGAFAALAHFLLDPSSQSALGGASGAIAACIGAFAFCFATQRVRILLFLLIIWKRFGVPAWVWSAFWFVSEVSTLTDAEGFGGVAVMAHVGGWLFGFVFAWVLTLAGIDERLASRYDATTALRPSPVAALMVGGIVVLVSVPIVLFAMPQRTVERPTGSVTISSKPAGATIYVDGELVDAKTPYEIAGVRLRRLTRVQVALADHRATPFKKDIVLNVVTRAKTAHFDLVETAPLTVTSKPRGARVVLDGRVLGEAPLTTPPLDVGHDAKLMFVLDGHLTAEHIVRVTGDDAPIEVKLVRARQMTFETQPEGATLRINGAVRGTTPTQIDVPRGRTFRIALEKPGYKPSSRRLRARAKLHVDLVPLRLGALALDPTERRRLLALRADRKNFDARLTRLRRQLATVTNQPKRGASVYDRLGGENEAEDLEAEIDQVRDQRAVVDEELEALRQSAVDRLGR